MDKRKQDAKELAELILMFMSMDREKRSKAYGYMRGIHDEAIARQSESAERAEKTVL